MLSVYGIYGLISSTGDPSRISTPSTRSLSPSTPTSFTALSPSGLGR